MDFSVIVKQIRKEIKLSQAELAEALGVNVATISRWENGHNLPNNAIAKQLLAFAKQECASGACVAGLKKLLQSETRDGELSQLSRVPMGILNQMVNSSAHAIYICDCETYELLYLNRTTAEMIHSTLEEAQGKKCYEYLMKRDSPCPFCSMQSRSADHFDEVEFLYPLTNRHYFMRGKLLDWEGRKANIEYVAEDMVQQYRHTAVDNMMDSFPFSVGVFNLYPTGQIELLKVNKSFYSVFQISYEEMKRYLGFGFLDFIYPPDRPLLTAQLLECLQKKSCMEISVRTSSGSTDYRWTKIQGTIAFEDADKAIMYWSLFDIDEQKKQIDQLHKSMAATKFLSNKGYISVWIYDEQTNSIEQLFDIRSSLGYSTIIPDGPNEIVRSGSIYKDDITGFLDMYRKIRMGHSFCEATVRVLNQRTAAFEWQNIRLNRIKRIDGDGYVAIGFSTNADLQKDAETRYEYESTVKREQIKSSLAYYRINLTARSIEEYHSKLFDPASIAKPLTVETIIQYGILDGVVEEDRVILAQALNIDTMLDRYQKGHRTESFVYRRMIKGEGLKWIEGTISKVKRSSTNEVIAFYTTRDVDRPRKAQLAIMNVLEEETENIILLNPESQTAQYIMDNRAMADFNSENNCQPFAWFRKRIVESAILADRGRLQEFLDVSTVRERLEAESVLQITYCVQTKFGAERRKKARFIYLDQSHLEILYIQRDITDLYIEEQRQKEALQAAMNREHLANRAKSDFLANMSHDLRTPLNAIAGFTALTFNEAGNAETVRENMKKLQEVSDYMLGLVEVILDASKLQSTSLRLFPRPYPYCDFLNGVHIMFAAQCKQKGITFTIISPERPPVIVVDQTRLNQLVYNLLSNAIRFTPQGGHVTLTVDTAMSGSRMAFIDFTIQDDGIGMSQEFQEKMFEPFTQESTAVTSELQGAGLGLYIAKNLINLMGGTIGVNSKLGEGTTVKVHFTFEVAGDAVISTVFDHEYAIKPIKALEGKTVLLVEDHPTNRLIARRLLEKQSMTVIAAKNGQEAVMKFSSSPPRSIDVILMDIRMPEMDGYTATKEIRALKRKDAKKVPIIAMSANAFEDDIAGILSAGMNAHLSKPIDPQLLYQTLEKHLRGGAENSIELANL